MMKQKQRLGRGIDALFSTVSLSSNSGVVELSVKEILPNPVQPRKDFDNERLSELSDSIKKNGLLSPILVRRNNSRYEIIAGERRFRAASLAGYEKIPCIIKEVSDEDSFRMSIIENIQREDLNPMEESEAYYTLNKHYKLSHQDIAEAVSKDRSTVSNSLRLNSLPEEIKGSLRAGTITTGHARAILSLNEYHEQMALFNSVIKNLLTVRETEKLASSGPGKGRTGKKKKNNEFDKISKNLSEKLSTKVTCVWVKKKGKILIDVYFKEDFERIASMISNNNSPL